MRLSTHSDLWLLILRRIRSSLMNFATRSRGEQQKKAVDGDGTDGKGSHSIISMAKSDLKFGVAACMAAEEAVEKTKEKVVMSFLEKCGNSQNAVEFLKKMFEEDGDDE